MSDHEATGRAEGPLSADDLVNFPLKQSVRGYSVKQVDELLDRVADQLERLQLEIVERRRQAEQATARSSQLEETESTLKRTLVMAQRAAEQTIEEARQRATSIVDEATQRAQQLDAEAQDRARRVEDELRQRLDALTARVDTLRALEREFRTNLRDLAQRQLTALEQLPSAEPRSLSSVADGDQRTGSGREVESPRVTPDDQENRRDPETPGGAPRSPSERPDVEHRIFGER